MYEVTALYYVGVTDMCEVGRHGLMEQCQYFEARKGPLRCFDRLGTGDQRERERRRERESALL